MNLRQTILTTSLASALVFACARSGPMDDASEVAAAATVTPTLKKVMVVLFENEDFADAAQQPFFKKLGAEGVLFNKFYAERHPSQPNYIALVSGSTQGVTSDANVNLDVDHLGDLLEAKGKTWKVYAEAYPGNCFLGAKAGTYVRKHVPFLSFKNVQSDPTRCAKIVNASQLDSDIAHGTLPDFSLFIPDLNNDGHDTSVSYADQWYKAKFGPLLTNPAFMDGMLLVTTFDEGSRSGDNRIYTSFYGAAVKPGTSHSSRISHFDLLKTIEVGMELGSLSEHDGEVPAISGIWQ